MTSMPNYKYVKDVNEADLQVEVDELTRETYEINTECSEISKFFSGKNVFITGATGFLGKILMEKIIRSCPDVEGIYLLMRPKKGKDTHERLDEIFKNIVFDKLSKIQPKFTHKVIPISGDVSLSGLGININDRKLLCKKVNIIFHCAATVRFNEKLKLAAAINVNGTKEMLNLAKECDNLVSMVHVSTAFAHCTKLTIDEIFYHPPMDTDGFLSFIEGIDEEKLETITKELLDPYPNTYTYTKAIAEQTVQKYGQGLPISIFRPAIVIASYKEPLRAYVDSIYGPASLIVGCGLGLIHTVNLNVNLNANLVPVDYVINGIIACCWKTASVSSNKIPIYNYVSSVENPLTWGQLCYSCRKYGVPIPSIKSVWYYSAIYNSNKYTHAVCQIFLHYIPGLLMDAILLLSGKKAEMTKLYKKIDKLSKCLNYFCLKEFHFTNNNVQKLWDDVPKKDQSVYPFSMKEIDWDYHAQMHMMGLRTYLLKEDISTLPAARKKWFRLYIAHNVLKFFFCLLIIYFLYQFFSRMIL